MIPAPLRNSRQPTKALRCAVARNNTPSQRTKSNTNNALRPCSFASWREKKQSREKTSFFLPRTFPRNNRNSPIPLQHCELHLPDVF